mgnify:CR=1 FL=1
MLILLAKITKVKVLEVTVMVKVTKAVKVKVVVLEMDRVVSKITLLLRGSLQLVTMLNLKVKEFI